MNDDERRAAACRHLPVSWWYPTKASGQDNHGRLAKSICATCPVRGACLQGAIERGEPYGIHGGAGEGRRRVLARARRTGILAEVVAAHWRQLDGDPEPGDRDLLSARSEGATCGRRVTYARTCRCEACSMAASFDGVVKSLRVAKPRRRTSEVAA